MSDNEPKIVYPRWRTHDPHPSRPTANRQANAISFNRGELNEILGLYGRKVSCGEWCDYAIDVLGEKAVFSVFRKATDFPLYRIEKLKSRPRRQGAYAVVAPGGRVLRRGRSLARVLRVLDSPLRLVAAGA